MCDGPSACNRLHDEYIDIVYDMKHCTCKELDCLVSDRAVGHVQADQLHQVPADGEHQLVRGHVGDVEAGEAGQPGAGRMGPGGAIIFLTFSCISLLFLIISLTVSHFFYLFLLFS